MSQTVKEFSDKTSAFNVLYSVNTTDKLKEKNKLTYLPWSSAWAEVKKVYPDATFKVFEQVIDDYGNTRPWFTDENSGWVKVSVDVDGLCLTETLAIMDFRNQAIKPEEITSVNANKSIKRCLVKCLALHGLALFVYEGEDLPEEDAKLVKVKAEIKDLIAKKGASNKEKVLEYCKETVKSAEIDFEDSDFSSDLLWTIDDLEVLDGLKRKLMAIRIKKA